MTAAVRLCATILAAVVLAGCYFDHPLTGWPTKELNTWYLGVWQTTDSKGRVSKAEITPIDNGRYYVKLTMPGSHGTKAREFEAWGSRIGTSTIMNAKCLHGDEEMPVGTYAFVLLELLDQNNLRVHTLQLDSPRESTPAALRKEIRDKAKAGTLLAPEHTNWKRIAEVFWSRDGSSPVFTPLRNPTY